MAYTTEDQQNLERAAIALATGSRKEAVTLSDGTRVEFTPVTLPQLRSFLAEVRAQVLQASSPPIRSFFLGAVSKGL